MRQFIFRHYGWLALFGIVAAPWAAYAFGGKDWLGLAGTALAGVLGFCYFVQQQKLSETQLFHSLFTAFNLRYDKLNGPLAEITSRNEPLSLEDRNLIIDYFNLCAEEYLYYKEGYIYRDVWRSWCHGMLRNLRRPPVKDVWNEEAKTESLYGLTLDVMLKGAGFTESTGRLN